SVVLRPGEKYTSHCIYQFGVKCCDKDKECCDKGKDCCKNKEGAAGSDSCCQKPCGEAKEKPCVASEAKPCAGSETKPCNKK
ncbi:MAG: hypothetical protein PHF38_07705, partial [Bacteroidales bacterium]|nr:hypothetical protein [Bacteroidales bacterium]